MAFSFLNLRFENDVKMYGTQVNHDPKAILMQFENDVKMYGIKNEMVFKESFLKHRATASI